MKIFTLIALTIITVLLVSCTKKEADTTTVLQTVVFQPPTYFIAPSQIYNTEAIFENFGQDNDSQSQKRMQEAKPFFEKAKSLETSNTQQSIHYYQKVLTYFPSAAIYKKLGDLLEQVHEKQEATSAYQTALLLVYSTRAIQTSFYAKNLSQHVQGFDKFLGLTTPPISVLYAGLIKNTLATQQYDELVILLTEAYEQKLIEKDKILKDESFKVLRETPAFKLFYALNMTEGNEKIAARRDYFLQGFDKKTLPLTLAPTPPTKNVYENYEYYNSPITEKYRNTLTDTSAGYTTLINIAQLKETPTYTLLLTAIDTTSFPSASDEFRNFAYILFSLDKQGTIADKMSVAYRSPWKEASATITENGIEMKLFDRQWKNKDYYKAGKNNELLGLQLVTSKKYEIDTSGKFIEIKQ